ncbi:Conjugal transfer protein [Thiomonas sp. X19]|uniref:type IV secretion system protein n=1 Tax=Thiomonas sp. X19 TaxID=1050370 RepID=UPI000B6E43EF|nr:type IV secretion system protein [Thiomonas sp. X19]SCC93196.1 Conjugal transfer protein [Thiomonas sp. X19]
MTDANPYLNARREWDERYGDALARARTWRLAAFASLAVAAVAVVGITFVGAQSKIRPYVVALDTMGNPVAMAQPVTGGAVDQRILEAQLANWVWNARSVIPDPAAQKTLIARVYAMAGSDAASALNRYYRQHPPFGDFTVNVTITSVLPVSGNTWQVGWNEVRSQGGAVQPAQHWRANITTGIDPKLTDSPQVMLDNPLGIFVKSLSWTPVVGGAA